MRSVARNVLPIFVAKKQKKNCDRKKPFYMVSCSNWYCIQHVWSAQRSGKHIYACACERRDWLQKKWIHIMIRGANLRYRMGLECASKYSMRKNCFACRAHSIRGNWIEMKQKKTYSKFVRISSTRELSRVKGTDETIPSPEPEELLYKRNGRWFLLTKNFGGFFECAGMSREKKVL